MSNDIETRAREFTSSPADDTPTIPKIAATNGHLDPAPLLMEFPSRTYDKIRFGDLDRQGHVNNSVFLTFMETGRVEILYDRDSPLTAPGTSFVIVRAGLDLRGEMFWPGTVSIGTRVTSIGRRSVKMQQALFQDGRCLATADIVLVAMDDKTRRSCPISSFGVRRLSELMTTAPASP